MTLFSCAVTITWWIVKLTPIPRESRRNPVTHKITEKMSARNVELWRVQIIMQKPRGVCLPHSIKTPTRGVGCSGKHGEVLSPLAMAHHMGSNIYSLRSLNSEVGVLEPGFPGNSFVVNLKGIEKKNPTLLCSHYQVIWSPLSALVMTCYFMRFFILCQPFLVLLET